MRKHSNKYYIINIIIWIAIYQLGTLVFHINPEFKPRRLDPHKTLKLVANSIQEASLGHREINLKACHH